MKNAAAGPLFDMSKGTAELEAAHLKVPEEPEAVEEVSPKASARLAALVGRSRLATVRGVGRLLRILDPEKKQRPVRYRYVTSHRRGGRVVASNEDTISWSIHVYGEYEPDVNETMRRFVEKGSTAVDVGANIGEKLVQLSKLVGPQGKVLGFEPNEGVWARLRTNLSLGSRNVSVYRVGLGSRRERRLLFPAADDNPNQGISTFCLAAGGRPGPGFGLGRETLIVPLDEIWQQCRPAGRLSFVKIDVEGFEVEVLRGARQVIRENHPVICVEIDENHLLRGGESIDSLEKEVAALGYAIRDLSGEPVRREGMVPGNYLLFECRGPAPR